MTHDPLPQVARLVDLDRYPIDDLASRRGRDVVAASQAEFDRTGACNLEGFVTPEGAAALAAEARALMPIAYRKTYTRNAYFNEDDPSLPADHPKRIFWTTSGRQLADDQIGAETSIRQLYEWDTLTRFVALVQGKKKLYRMADEFQALNIIAIGEGSWNPWHYDHNECTVTLLLQAPEAGGEFRYGPDTRWPGGEDLDAVRRLFDEEPGAARVLARENGTLTMFRGLFSMHGVAPVRGKRDRITAILTYDERPDCVDTDETNIGIYGPRVERLLARRRAAEAPGNPDA